VKGDTYSVSPVIEVSSLRLGKLHAFLTSVTPATLAQENELLLPIKWENLWARDAVWTLWRRGKFLAPAENQTPDSSAVQPVAHRHTDRATPAPLRYLYIYVCLHSFALRISLSNT
jgi:hypothetical protein